MKGKGNLWRISIALPEFTPSRKINILEILENASHNIDTIFLKTKKIKDCQVVQTRISRHHGGKDHKTELQVGAVDENDLYKVMALLTKIICLLHGMVITGIWCRQLLLFLRRIIT